MNDVTGTERYDAMVIEMSRKDPVFAAAYLRIALEEIDEPGGEQAFLVALRHVVEARGGMTEIARRAGLSRESLYRTLSAQGNPTLRTLHKVINAAGLTFAQITHTAATVSGKPA